MKVDVTCTHSPASRSARYGAHLSPLLSPSAHYDTHLDSITSLITCSIYVTPFGSFPRCHCFCSSVMSVRCLGFMYYFVFIYTPSLNLLPNSVLPSLQNDTSPKESISKCFFVLEECRVLVSEPELPGRPQPVCRIPMPRQD